jgi:hypothetical protein
MRHVSASLWRAAQFSPVWLVDRASPGLPTPDVEKSSQKDAAYTVACQRAGQAVVAYGILLS